MSGMFLSRRAHQVHAFEKVVVLKNCYRFILYGLTNSSVILVSIRRLSETKEILEIYYKDSSECCDRVQTWVRSLLLLWEFIKRMIFFCFLCSLNNFLPPITSKIFQTKVELLTTKLLVAWTLENGILLCMSYWKFTEAKILFITHICYS